MGPAVFSKHHRLPLRLPMSLRTFLGGLSVSGGLAIAISGLLVETASVSVWVPSAYADCSCQGAVFVSRPYPTGYSAYPDNQILRECRNPDGTYTEELVADTVNAGPLTFGPDHALYAAVGNEPNVFNSVVRFDPNTGANLGTYVQPGDGGLTRIRAMQFSPDGAELYILDQNSTDDYQFGCPGTYCGTLRRYYLDAAGGHAYVHFPVPGVPANMRFGPNGMLYITSGGFNHSDVGAVQSTWTLLEMDPLSGQVVGECLGPAAFGQTGASGFCLHDATAQPQMFNCNPYSVESIDATHLYVGDDCGVIHLISVASDGTCSGQSTSFDPAAFQSCGGIYCSGLVVIRRQPLDLVLGQHPPAAGEFLHALNQESVASGGCVFAAFSDTSNVGGPDASETQVGPVDVVETSSSDFEHATPDPGVRYAGIALQPSVACDDGNACTDETCDMSLACHHTPVNCDDGDPCTDDSCDPASGCVHSQKACPAFPCHDAGTCDSTTGRCVFPQTSGACNDGDPCTIGDSCRTDTASVDGWGCVGDPGPAGCDPANSNGAAVGGAGKKCDGGTIDADGNCVITAGNVNLTVPLDGPPFAVDPAENISVINHKPDAPCTQFFSVQAADDAARLLSCTEFLPHDYAFQGGKAATVGFSWTNTGTGGAPACDVSTSTGTVKEGTLGIFRNGVGLVGNGSTTSRCNPDAACPTVPLSQTCTDQSICTSETCDPAANTLTLNEKHFSEYAVAVPCSAVAKTRLRLSNLGKSGKGRLIFSGHLPLPAVFDPVADGIIVTLNDASGVTLDAVLSGGSFWRVGGTLKNWTYLNYERTTPGGVYKVRLDASGGDLRFQVRGRRGSYAGGTHVRAGILLGTSGQCFDARFPGPRPAPTCVLRGAGGTVLDCR